MPRVTRAALRSQELHEDPASIPLPLTPIKGRAPLGETAGNINAQPSTANTSQNNMTAAKKGPGKGKKGNNTKKNNKQKTGTMEEPNVEVLEDDNQSQTSSAAEEASKELLKETSSADADSVAMDDQRPHTPPSAAVEEVSQHLSPKPTTPQIQPEQHMPENIIQVDRETGQEDPTLMDIDSGTPMKTANENGLGISTVGSGEEEDSFVEQIKTRTPAKRISRIEDSVEALDALEEEIEKVGGLIPESTDVQSSVKPEKVARSSLSTAKPNGSMRIKKRTTAAAPASNKKPTTNIRPSVSRRSIQPAAAKKASPPLNGTGNKSHESTANKTSPNSKTTPQPAQMTHKRRVSSIHKAPFQPAKSAKPPTRAIFELPGEAISRKLKEQREERLKREEAEQNSKRPGFKARPVPRTQAPEVKLTAAARARLSMAKGESIDPPSTKNKVSRPRLSVRPGSVAAAVANKCQSSLSVAKRNTNPPAADSSAQMARAPSLDASTRTRKVSIAGAPRAAPTAEDLAHQKVKGKEVFGRAKVEIKERENARKEKEEAAKKARAEAAERGRIASRAWAEQQKLKKLEAAKTKNKTKAEEVSS